MVPSSITPALFTRTSSPPSSARVLMADRFAGALQATVTDERLSRLPLVGGVDQLTDGADVLADPGRYRRLVVFYEPA